MNTRELVRLTALSRFDVGDFGSVSFSPNYPKYPSDLKFDFSRLVYRSGKFKLFKCLLSDVCNFDCKYCINPCKGRVTLKPEEFARAFLTLRNNGLADGAFISSAMYRDPEIVMEDLIKTAELIRREFKGYIHLKILPGATRDQVSRAAKVANRISINFEVAEKSMFSEICSVKSIFDIKRRERWINKYVSRFNRSYTTQIIVGLGETDEDIVKFLGERYKMGVSRVYFSPFRALKGTPFEKLKNENRKRIVNLYRADFLVRLYRVDVKKLASVAGVRFAGDPKLLLAEKFGVEKLTDIPGIGLKTCKHKAEKLKEQYLKQRRLSEFLN